MPMTKMNSFKELRFTCLIVVALGWGSSVSAEAQTSTHRIGVLTPGLTFEPALLGLKEG